MNLTDLPDELLYKIFNYLNFVDRIDARTVDKKMAAFQSRNYSHIFDDIRVEFNKPYIKDIVCENMYFNIIPVFSTNKVISKGIFRRELSKKYISKFKYLYNYVCHCYYFGEHSITHNYTRLVRLLAEFAYTCADYISLNINYIIGQNYPYPMYNIPRQEIFNELIKFLLMYDIEHGIEYYHTALKHGLYLHIHDMRYIANRYPDINRIITDIDITTSNVSFVKLFIFSPSNIDYIHLAGFNVIDSIDYYRPSSISNPRALTDMFLEYLLYYYEGNETYLSKKEITKLRLQIYSKFLKQSKKDDSQVYQQAVVDSHRIKSINGVLQFV